MVTKEEVLEKWAEDAEGVYRKSYVKSLVYVIIISY
jgi:hypothetical protein